MENVHHVGALSLDNLDSIEFFTDEAFFEKFGCLIDAQTILVTLHPETRSGGSNAAYADVVASALERLKDWKVVITMPNADTEGTLIRERFNSLKQGHAHRVSIVENMGTRGYFTALKKCGLVLGNSSSGILEAAAFHKRVINIGDRQLGRICGENVTHVPFDIQELETAVRTICQLPPQTFESPYFAGGAANKIVKALKLYLGSHGS
jgi:GDP/UDP-N,N'-diacetylbacillosamine 2-epimerase (hydrolysing)